MTTPRAATPGLRVGIDIGGTKTLAVVVDGDLGVLAQCRLDSGTGPAAVVDTAVAAAGEATARAGIDLAAIDSVGVGIPGWVNARTGTVSHAVNLGVANLDLQAALSERLGRPVVVDNDVRAAALGAYHLHVDASGRRPGSMAYLNLGTGLAAGVIVDGRLWRGQNGLAGEIGHVPVDPAGLGCPCGQRGCLETVASGSGLARRWPAAVEPGVASLFAAAAAGDRDARELRDGLVGGVAAAVRLLVLVCGVERVLLGGGLSESGDLLLTAVAGRLSSWSADSPLLGAAQLAQRVALAPAHGRLGAVGAALLAHPEHAPQRSPEATWKS